MGLAAPRKRVKISHDPNNTTWAQSTSGFGHKIMTSQGWTPGSYLGARNANHADTFTAASASHIRVTLKDDTLGLGARPRTLGNDDVAAIDAFQGLLGRLNGKSDVQLEQEQRKRDDTRLALYASKKWQAVTFVSGGYLVQEKPDDVLKSKSKKKYHSSNDTTVVDKASFGKSSDDSVDDTPSQSEDAVSSVKAGKSSRTAEAKDTKEKSKKKDKEGKKEKSDKKVKKEKKDKKERKERKERKREKEQKKKDEKDSSKKRRRAEEDLDSESSESSSLDEADNKASQQKATSTQAPRPNWRHAIRGRHIQQKRMAIMDDRSLGEVSIQLICVTIQFLIYMLTLD
ncbi:G-patch RNA maturation protein (Gno1), putative [Talaromyces stipitatus ATCC 10500]|uniref:Protein PXR1 n=1 Tax=Talaromyces stipitatus (strain ATCC 10500 / CBS 375.48 / QM 6759 / NRRL 1006) TaxID=441959 RepID=B8M0V8_TALSN|nr:G-patch RNA maturation protein (Gno1), putative [Talaromyces stipitatus ATCC 10500]EED21738.1 G-patch RNA maturation protein (Gno1), putative [Talaromyces stipitatus ATCC 10500]